MNRQELLKKEVDVVLENCECSNNSCRYNYAACRTTAELLDKFALQLGTAANHRGELLNDLVSALYEEDERQETKDKLNSYGEALTLRLAAYELLAIACFKTAYHAEPKEYMRRLRAMIEAMQVSLMNVSLERQRLHS